MFPAGLPPEGAHPTGPLVVSNEKEQTTVQSSVKHSLTRLPACSGAFTVNRSPNLLHTLFFPAVNLLSN